MSEVQRLLGHYAKAVQFSGASGFEVLELLDVRTRLAAREGELDEAQRAELVAFSTAVHIRPLPPAARRHRAWWANDGPSDF